MKTIFLDFDGVLFDTLKEAFVLCRYAFGGVDIYEPIDEVVYERFYRYKFLVYNSWQYYYVMKLLNDSDIKTDDDFILGYRNYLENRDLQAEQDFDKKYLAQRLDMMKEHSQYWDSLEQPFEFFYGVKQLFESGKIDIVIVSKKDKVAIKKRLSQYGLLIEDENIVAKSELLPYDTKADFIAEHMSKNAIERAVFVDDNSNNLTPCKVYPQITQLLAGWGNIAIGEVGLKSDEVIAEIIKN